MVALLEPPFDYPVAAKTYKVVRVVVSGFVTLAWFSDRELVYSVSPPPSGGQPIRERTLSAWDGQSQPRQIANGVRWEWCAAAGRLSIESERTSQTHGATKTTTARYRAGGLDAQKEAEFTASGVGAGWTVRHNMLDCSYEPGDLHSATWISLKSGDGRLYAPLGDSSRQIVWHRPDTAPVMLPLPMGTITFRCISHYADEGHFLWPCHEDHSLWQKWEADHCIPSVFIRPSGAVDKICLPTFDQFRFPYETVSPSRIGFIFGTQLRQYPTGNKPGGFYRLGENGIEKILEGEISPLQAPLSPDRCRIAFQTDATGPTKGREIEILNLCD